MSDSGPTKTINILLVEDNPEDADWTEETLDRIPGTRVRVVEDGVAALAFLRREGKYVTEVKPHVILLDMRLPKKSGWEVLEEIERDLGLRLIPVVVMTGVDTETDDAVRRNCNGRSNRLGCQPEHVDLFRLNLAGIRDGCFCHCNSSDRQRKVRRQLYCQIVHGIAFRVLLVYLSCIH